MFDKLKSMIKIAVLKSLTDGEVHQVGTFDYMGMEQKAVMYSPYGLYSNPPDDSYAILAQVGGSESRQVAFISDPRQRPTLAKGEVGLQVDGGKMSVLLHKDGTIEIKGETKEMVAVLSSFIDHAKDLSTNLQSAVTDLISATVPTALGPQSLSVAIPWAVPATGLLAKATTNITDINNDKTDLDTMKV